MADRKDDRAGAPSTAPRPRNQWPSGESPSGMVLGFGLDDLDEDALLGPDGRGALHPLALTPEDVRPDREALVLVHGILGAPRDLAAVVDRLWRPGPAARQLFVYCYDDYHRRTGDCGLELADALRALFAWQRPGPEGERRVAIVAHSLGGIVTRRALNALSLDGGAAHIDRLRAVCVDTPWHGYGGPADRGLGRLAMSFVRPLLPDGLEDMRSESALFTGDPSAALASCRAPLLDAALDDRVAVDLVFASEGDEILDYTEGALAAIPGALAAWFNDAAPVRLPPPARNHYHALRSSSGWPRLRDALVDRAAATRLADVEVLRALEAAFPRLPGDHTGVLAEHPGRRSFLDWLDGWLDPREPDR